MVPARKTTRSPKAVRHVRGSVDISSELAAFFERGGILFIIGIMEQCRQSHREHPGRGKRDCRRDDGSIQICQHLVEKKLGARGE